MVVQHNITAMNSNRMLNVTTGAQAKSTEKLSSGYKINRAADDAAGLSISEKMRKQMRGLTQASANAQDGISAVQTAEGALTEVHDMLQRMNELAVKAANGTMSTSDRVDVNNEVKALSTEISRVATTTKFNEIYLLSGSGNFKLQVGADNKNDNTISVSIASITATTIGVNMLDGSFNTPNSVADISGSKWTKIGDCKNSGINMLSGTNAARSIDFISNAIKEVSMRRSELGAIQNRLEHTIKNLDNVIENTTAAESAIRDTDMATEMVQFSKNNILAQAGQSMLAQANQSNQGVLSLLG
ncbi:MAG: flagellin [Lachnospiraceae bacterium]|nr:flagellin [Lachnospiraceae bacterium]